MIIVKLTGGLGNQMFQYALYSSLSGLNKNAFIDDFSFQKRHKHEETSLKSVFPQIQYQKASEKDVARFSDLKMDYFNKIRRKVIGMRKTHIDEKDIDFKDEILQLNGDYYLDGYWQSEKYFSRISDGIRKDFAFRPIADPEKHRLMEKMKEANSVSIHVRKANDFQTKSRINTCGVDYYKRAIEKIRNSVSNAVFYIFSDNFDWCRANLDFAKPVFVEMNPSQGPDNYLDMQMMSYCKHNIIANSTYSWWAAWLNTNKGKLIIAPATWFNRNTSDYKIEDIVPDGWMAF